MSTNAAIPDPTIPDESNPRLHGMIARGMRLADQLKRTRDGAVAITELCGDDARAIALHLACKRRLGQPGYHGWLR